MDDSSEKRDQLDGTSTPAEDGDKTMTSVVPGDAEKETKGGDAITSDQVGVSKSASAEGRAPEDVESATPALPPPHTVFTQGEVYFIIAMTSLAALISPVSTTIYLPALPTLADALHVSITKINLTVTTYLVSMFWIFHGT